MAPIIFFTDFGFYGPYVGQMKMAVEAIAPEASMIDLMHDAPHFDPKASSYLLGALVSCFPWNAICVGVVDPGVGSERTGVILAADGRFFVGPGNGLFEIARRRSKTARMWVLPPNAEASPSFHGRDIFAPTAAQLALGRSPEEMGARPVGLGDLVLPDWPDDLAELIYFDHYGNAMTGLRTDRIARSARLRVIGTRGEIICEWARTFSAADPGTAFWYENSNGLVEIAVSSGSARDDLGLSLGLGVEIL
jgi:S-adenosylmethionine hydrolase